jgi:hypothetical protein
VFCGFFHFHFLLLLLLLFVSFLEQFGPKVIVEQSKRSVCSQSGEAKVKMNRLKEGIWEGWFGMGCKSLS